MSCGSNGAAGSTVFSEVGAEMKIRQHTPPDAAKAQCTRVTAIGETPERCATW